MIMRLQYWLDHSTPAPTVNGDASTSASAVPSPIPACEYDLPEFPLLPVSKGFRFTLQKNLDKFKSVLESVKDSV